MASVFEVLGLEFNEGYNPRSKQDYINAPLARTNQKLPKGFHSRAKRSGAFTLDVEDEGLSNLLAEMGKLMRVKSNKIVEFVIINDVSRPATNNEINEGRPDDVFYAKFVEYGYTTVKGNFVPGKRLFARIRKKMKRRLIANYKLLPKRVISLKSLEKAMSDTVKWAVEELERITPISTDKRSGKNGKTMSESWKYKKLKYTRD